MDAKRNPSYSSDLPFHGDISRPDEDYEGALLASAKNNMICYWSNRCVCVCVRERERERKRENCC